MTTADETAIDPRWWEGALYNQDDDLSMNGWIIPELASTELQLLAEACSNRDSLRARTLQTLADVTSAMLSPDSDGEPFAPAMSWDGRRTILPRDLDDEQYALLAAVAPLVESPLVRARAADAAWTYAPSRDRAMLITAVDAYLEIPLEKNAWRGPGENSWRRAVALLRSQGGAHRERLADIRELLLRRVLATTPSDGWMALDLGLLLRDTGRISRDQSAAVALHLNRMSSDDDIPPRLIRHLIRGARAWFSRAGDDAAAMRCTVELAAAYEVEGARRLGAGNGQAMTAGHSFEKAISALMALPRSYRGEHGLDLRVRLLRDRLAESRAATLEAMVAIDTEPLDITDYANQARQHVSGHEQLDAILRLAGIAGLTDAEQARQQARDGLTAHPLSRLFPGETFSADGRRVAATRSDLGDPGESEIWDTVVRNFGIRIGLVVQACIAPARDALAGEHHLSLDYIERLCWDSPVVSEDRVRLWARGLWHGFHGDLPSAVVMLVPQFEHLVRHVLKAREVHTLTVDELTGVESEKGLGALLSLPECDGILGPGLRLEMRALLVEQGGANLRNEVAHGLLNDAAAWSAPAMYAWWLALKLVLMPLRVLSTHPHDDEIPDGPPTS